jgi:hypothetical protein
MLKEAEELLTRLDFGEIKNDGYSKTWGLGSYQIAVSITGAPSKCIRDTEEQWSKVEATSRLLKLIPISLRSIKNQICK